jgi:thiamine-phosphate pyrophosphorylase
MLVTDRRRTGGRDLATIVATAVEAGVGIVQVREGDLSSAARLDLVREIRRAVPTGTLLTVNSDATVARSTGSGLHLPATAPSPEDPPDLFGRSIHDEEEARAAFVDPVTYAVAGTLFATRSKPGRPGTGVEALSRLVPLAGGRPVLGIGGVSAENVAGVLAAGAHGVAVCGAILEADDPAAAAARLARAIEESTGD